MPKIGVIFVFIGMLSVAGGASCQLPPLSESEFSEFLNLQNAHPHLSTPVHNSSFIIHNSNTPCYSTIHHNSQLSKNVIYSRQNQNAERFYQEKVEKEKVRRNSTPTPLTVSPSHSLTYTIPVVIHLVNPPGQSLLTDTEIQQGLSFLNGVLAGTESCAGDPLSTPTGIQFCLAQQDIFGNVTTGIRRYTNTLTDVDVCTQELALKQLPRLIADSFPTTDYLNIYLVHEICASCQPWNCATAGFATLPAAHGTVLDGLLLEAHSWYNDNCDVRKLVVHEIGHYFNLLHTFAGGCKNDNCLHDGDRVCDTPPDDDANAYSSNNCTQANNTNSCNTDVNAIDPNNPFTTDQNDPTENFMDYSPLSCQHRFTPGQVLRMQAAILGPRASLLQSKGCMVPCTDTLMPAFTISDSTLILGDTLFLSNISQGVMTHKWQINDAILHTNDVVYIPDTTGVFAITLYTWNVDSTCTAITTDSIVVNCGFGPLFLDYTPRDIVPDEPVIFYPDIVLPDNITLQWYVNDSLISTSDTMIFTFMDTTYYDIQCIAQLGTCKEIATDFFFFKDGCATGKEGWYWTFGTGTGQRFSLHLMAQKWCLQVQYLATKQVLLLRTTMATFYFILMPEHIYNKNHEQMELCDSVFVMGNFSHLDCKYWLGGGGNFNHTCHYCTAARQ